VDGAREVDVAGLAGTMVEMNTASAAISFDIGRNTTETVPDTASAVGRNDGSFDTLRVKAGDKLVGITGVITGRNAEKTFMSGCVAGAISHTQANLCGDGVAIPQEVKLVGGRSRGTTVKMGTIAHPRILS